MTILTQATYNLAQAQLGAITINNDGPLHYLDSVTKTATALTQTTAGYFSKTEAPNLRGLARGLLYDKRRPDLRTDPNDIRVVSFEEYQTLRASFWGDFYFQTFSRNGQRLIVQHHGEDWSKTIIGRDLAGSLRVEAQHLRLQTGSARSQIVKIKSGQLVEGIRRFVFRGEDLEILLDQVGTDFVDSPALLALLWSALWGELPRDQVVTCPSIQIYPIKREDGNLFADRDNPSFTAEALRADKIQDETVDSVRGQTSFVAEVTMGFGDKTSRKILKSRMRKYAAVDNPDPRGNVLSFSFTYSGFPDGTPAIRHGNLRNISQLIAGAAPV